MGCSKVLTIETAMMITLSGVARYVGEICTVVTDP